MSALAVISPALSQWYSKTTRKNAPKIVMPREPEQLLQYLKPNRRDTDQRPIMELGLFFGAWNGANEGVSASMQINCGGYSRVVGNAAVISFDPRHSPTLEVLSSVLKAAVEAFDPDRALVRLEGQPSTERQPSVPLTYTREAGFS
jgi:hypothetical protein